MTKAWFCKGGRPAVIAWVALALAGCISTPPVDDLPPAPRDGAVSLQSLPTLPKLDPYRLQVGDVLDIKLMLNPELNDQVIVRPDGMISTTIAEDVEAYGHTV